MRGVENRGKIRAWDLQGVRKKRSKGSGHQGRLRGGMKENQEMRCKYLIGNFIYPMYHMLGIKWQGFVIRQTEGKSQVSHYLCDLVTCLFFASASSSIKWDIHSTCLGRLLGKIKERPLFKM